MHEATASLLWASCELDNMVKGMSQRISCPTLMMMAGNDQIIDNSKSKQWFQTLSTSLKEWKEYPDAQHTLEFEQNREEIFLDLVNWLQNTE